MKESWRTKLRREIARKDKKEWLSMFSVFCLAGGYMNFVCNRCDCKGEIKSWKHEDHMLKFNLSCSGCGNKELKCFIVDSNEEKLSSKEIEIEQAIGRG